MPILSSPTTRSERQAVSDILTTEEAARLCGENDRTVLGWIERGLLRSCQWPGRDDHRVPVEELRRFMREHGIPDRTRPARAACRVLIADDEPPMARAIERLLRGSGLDVETAIAPSGFEAGAMLYTFRPDVMTLDLRMPGFDGISVLRFLQRVRLLTPLRVLVVSADTEAQLRESLAQGAHEVLRKPFADQDLLAAVERLMVADPLS